MHILDFVRKLPGEKANIQLSLSNTISFNSASIKQLFVCGKGYPVISERFLLTQQDFILVSTISQPFSDRFPPFLAAKWDLILVYFPAVQKSICLGLVIWWNTYSRPCFSCHLTHLDAYDLENILQVFFYGNDLGEVQMASPFPFISKIFLIQWKHTEICVQCILFSGFCCITVCVSST